MAKISLIIPVYNVEDYLDVCLDSVLIQSFKDFEAICIDDGSDDSSLDILERYSKFDKRIKVFHKENGGLSDARNFGMEKVTGEYTMFVDSDDWLSYVILERLHNNIVKYNSDFNFCGVRKVNDFSRDSAIWLLCQPDEFKNYLKAPFFSESDMPSEFIYKMHSMAWGKLYRSEFIKDLRFPNGKIFEDNPFFTECYLSAKRISYDDKPMYYYRVNRSGSIIGARAEKYLDIFDIADMVKDIFIRYSKYERYKTDYVIRYFESFFYYTIRNKDPKTRERIFNLFKERLANFDLQDYNQEKIKKEKEFETIFAMKDMNYQEFMKMISKGGIYG